MGSGSNGEGEAVVLAGTKHAEGCEQSPTPVGTWPTGNSRPRDPAIRGIIDFITGFGPILAAGVEKSGSYGAELSRLLIWRGIPAVEVMRPNKQARRLQGKSDPLDAYQAAESVLSGRSSVIPKSQDSALESLRALRAARATAMRARVAVLAQVKTLLITAPETIRAKYRAMTNPALMAALEKHDPQEHQPNR